MNVTVIPKGIRWLWHEWVSPDKAWVGTETPYDDQDRQLFAACTTIHLGNGELSCFWHDVWIQVRRPKDIAPGLYAKTKKKKRMVADALRNNNWIRDLNHCSSFNPAHLNEFATLWNLI